MDKLAIYDVRFVTKDGPDGYFAQLDNDGVRRLTERLAEYTASGDITEAEVRLIDKTIAVTEDQLKEILEGMFGVLEKGRPDVSRVEERFDPKTEKIVRNLLTGAFEGGSNYWYRIESEKYPPGSSRADFRKGGRMQPPDDYFPRFQLIPTFPGGQLVIHDDVGEGEGEDHILDLPALKKGLMLLKQKYPQVYRRVMDEDDDATDADMFLQLSLFGDVIFG